MNGFESELCRHKNSTIFHRMCSVARTSNVTTLIQWLKSYYFFLKIQKDFNSSEKRQGYLRPQ